MIAHLHHAWDNYNRMGRTRQALQNAVLASLFQFTYTTLFGWYASYLFVRTGSVWPSILNHSFCNMMGIPSFDHSKQRSFIQKTSKFSKDVLDLLFLTGSIVIYVSFPLGVILFIYCLDSLTATASSMYWYPRVYIQHG
jgi:prenyl protein peptidase